MRQGIVAAVLIAFISVPPASAAEGEALRPLDQTVTLLDAGGAIHDLQPQADAAARVFVFLHGECPISRSYVPLLNRLHEAWQKDGDVALLGVWADVATTPADIAKFAAEFEVGFPILVDRAGELASQFQPTHVPEAFVLDSDGRLAYRGRIDDAFPDLGRRRLQATDETLANAVAAIREGQPVANPTTEPVGCLYETPPAAPPGAAELTYTRDVAPILFANCAVCHREGEVGPFPLTEYQHAAKRAGQIALVVERRLMPPWKAAQVHGEFAGQRTLTEAQIATLKAWASSGRAEGDASDLPPLPAFPATWPLGEPDLVLEMQTDFEVPADGADIFQNFVIPIDVPEDKLVATIDFRPGNRRAVHHSLLFLDNRGRARELDAKTPEPGYPSFGAPGFVPSGSIGGWSPGKTPRPLPDGIGRYLRKGSDLVMQVHYHPTGKREIDRSKVGVYFVENPRAGAGDIWASSHSHDIPAGEANYRMTASYTLPSEVLMISAIPHMHLLGRDLRATAVLPSGEQRLLIHVPDWNFNWQDEYRFVRPFKLPAGTRIDVEAVYDNSGANPLNPSSPPQRVTWGESTTDEMLYCFFTVSTDDPRELRKVLGDSLWREIASKAQARFGR